MLKKQVVLRYLLWILSGAVCFYVSQPLIRIPLLDQIQRTADFAMFALLDPVTAVLGIGFSAGVFEETFRFVFKVFLLRPARCTITQPVLFGLGHGTMEACFLILPLLMSGYSVGQLWLGLVERALAIILHVALTILVWNGFQRNKKILFLALAITVHGLVDSTLPLLLKANLPAVQIELVFGAAVLIITSYAVYSRRFYIQGGDPNGKAENPV